MPNNAYTVLLYWNFFTTRLLYFCCEGLRKTLKLQKTSKYLSLEETGESYKLAFVSEDNLLTLVKTKKL